jgi:hypothetical protein
LYLLFFSSLNFSGCSCPAEMKQWKFITIDLYSLWNCSQVQLTASHA